MCVFVGCISLFSCSEGVVLTIPFLPFRLLFCLSPLPSDSLFMPRLQVLYNCLHHSSSCSHGYACFSWLVFSSHSFFLFLHFRTSFPCFFNYLLHFFLLRHVGNVVFPGLLSLPPLLPFLFLLSLCLSFTVSCILFPFTTLLFLFPQSFFGCLCILLTRSSFFFFFILIAASIIS